MSELIRGEDVVIAEYNAEIDSWVIWGCARTCSLNLDTQFIETTVTGSGSYAEFLPTKHSFSGQLQGLIKLNVTDLVSLPTIRDYQINKVKLLLRFIRTGTGGTENYTSEGYFYIKNTSDEGTIDGMASFTVDLQGTGALTESFDPTDFSSIVSVVKRYEYTGTGGESSFTAATLIGKTILAVHKDGIGSSKMIVTGSPADKQVRLTGAYVSDKEVLLSGGDFAFAVPFEVGEEAYVLYR
jgi:predicted secreted protein